MWTLALVVATLLGQEGVGSEWVPPVVNAAGSITVAGVLMWRLLKADKETEACHQEVVDLHKQTVAAAERMAPLLAEATRTLQDVRGGLEATLVRAGRGEDDHTEQTIRRLEAVLREAGRRGLP